MHCRNTNADARRSGVDHDTRPPQPAHAPRRNRERILSAPHRGERHDDILPGVRHLTTGRAIYRFDIDELRETMRVLAMLFGGQNHVRHMMARLLEV